MIFSILIIKNILFKILFIYVNNINNHTTKSSILHFWSNICVSLYKMILIFKYIIPKRYIGLTIYPFIFLKNSALKNDSTLINHEKIHLKQQLELLWIFFFTWYFIEFIVKFIQYKNWNLAYRNISFEREAYQNECNLEYLKNRKRFSFLNYLK